MNSIIQIRSMHRAARVYVLSLSLSFSQVPFREMDAVHDRDRTYADRLLLASLINIRTAHRCSLLHPACITRRIIGIQLTRGRARRESSIMRR